MLPFRFRPERLKLITVYYEFFLDVTLKLAQFASFSYQMYLPI